MNQIVFDILNHANFLNHAKEQKIYYDISNNLQNQLNNPLLSKKLALSIAIAIATNEKNFQLKNILTGYATQNLLSDDELVDIQATVSIMSMNNTLYKFKHFINQEAYLQKPSGLKMTSKAKPNFGKKTFEILALCISIVNSCQVCTIHHEEKCRELEFTTNEIYAAVQLTSTIKSITTLEFSTQ
jgi:alkyl hydroperoxide reductase subunit D